MSRLRMISAQNLRQTLVIIGMLSNCISDGYIFGQMSGMLADLQSANSTIPLTEDNVSWIASSINATCVFGFVLAAIFSERLGIRRTISFLTMPIIASWVMIYYAQDFTIFMISRIFVGVCFGGVLILIYTSTAEYTPPNIRQLCMYIITAVGTAIGTTLGHIFSILLPWRTAALIGIIPTGLAALLPFFWVESPQWLASKGRFKECETAFKALFEENTATKTELQLLLQVERCKLEKASVNTVSLPSVMKTWLKSMKQTYFWKLFLMCNIIGVYRAVAGKVLFGTCAVTILENVTGRSDILLFTLLVDGLVILGSFMSCFLINVMKMRTLLFSTGIMANIVLIMFSACLYYNKPGNDDIYFAWINTILLGVYFITVYAGPYPVLESFLAEIFPNGLKGFFLIVMGSINGVYIFLSVKLAPGMFLSLGYHGFFFVNAMIMLSCLLYFWKYIPETKGRTLQEIELYFKNNKFSTVSDLIDGEQIKVLI